MNLNKICENILEPFEEAISATGTGYLEIVFKEENRFRSVFKKVYSPDFPYLSFEVLDKNMGLEKLEALTHAEQLSKYQKTIHCYISPQTAYKVASGFLIIQSNDPVKEEHQAFIKSLSRILNNFYLDYLEDYPKKNADKKPESDEKYHNELMNIRDIQAKLFPRFDDIDEFDIRSAYLPAELMSGTFIDGFFADKTTYVLAACDVSDYGPASLFVGAAIRTIIRSEEVQKMIPSMMISTIEGRVKNLTAGGNVSNIYITIYQLNLKTGRVILSSYGPVSSLFYASGKKGIIDLGNTEAGKLFAKRTFFRDLSINMEAGDTMLYYTRGVLRARKQGRDAEYGLDRLKEKTKENIAGESLELVHSITESVYEFTDYDPVKQDIILISMKKK